MGSTLRLTSWAKSRGKDSRTTLPPVCGSFHSHSLLRSLPMPTTCRARTERCSSLRSSRIVYRPTHNPRCGRRSGMVWLVGDELTVTDIGSRLTNSRVSACCAAPKPDWLFTTSAQCSVKPVPQRLCRAGGTLSAVNRLVLHSHSLQAQCFAAGASRVVGGVSLPEVLHYARRTPSASPPFEHSLT